MSTETPTTIPTDDGAMPALRVEPDTTESDAVIVLLQEIFGVTPYIRRRAADLAELGYRVLVPHIYWRLDDAEIPDADADALPRGMAVAGRLDWDRAVADAAAAIRAARELGDGRVGLVGFCFGGGLAFATAAVEAPDTLVSYYGSALPTLLGLADQVTVPSLHHFGEADAFIDFPTVERIRAAIATRPDVEFHTYRGANHAFDGAVPQLHNDGASELAWERTVGFLARTLP